MGSRYSAPFDLPPFGGRSAPGRFPWGRTNDRFPFPDLTGWALLSW